MNTTRVKAVGRSIAVILALLQTWSTRHDIFSDGISYLDIASAYGRGDWPTAVNAYWSPLYSWVLAGALAIVRPSGYWEAATLHLVNLGAFLFSLLTFELLVSEFSRRRRTADRLDQATDAADWPESAWVVAAYSVFIWSSLRLIGIGYCSPDMIVLGLLYLTSALLLRIREGRGSPVTFVVLGITLGVGYLAKAAMLPLAGVFLCAAFLSERHQPGARGRTILAALALLSVCAPFIVALSLAKGRLTVGDAAKLNYAWEVGAAARSTHWQGEPGDLGTPRHPTRKIHEVPDAYEFGEPIAGTYPPWFDPSYWYDGVAPRLSVGRQVSVFASFALYSCALLLTAPGVLLAGLLALQREGRAVARARMSRDWPILLPCVAGLCMYSLVYVDRRYVAGFLAVLALTIFDSVRLPRKRAPIGYWCVAVSATLTLAALTGRATWFDLRTAATDLYHRSEAHPNLQWALVEHFRTQGVAPETKVAYVGLAINAHWVRLIGARIVAEVPFKYDRNSNLSHSLRDDLTEIEQFWRSGPDVRAKVVRAFRDSGAEVIVADHVPQWASPESAGWRRVGSTSTYVYASPTRPSP